jgi:hypothetical protein
MLGKAPSPAVAAVRVAARQVPTSHGVLSFSLGVFYAKRSWLKSRSSAHLSCIAQS